MGSAWILVTESELKALEAIARRSRRSGTAEDSPLKKRQSEILRLVAEGFTNPEIAAALYLSEQTVKFHLNDAFRKTGAQNRAHLVAMAVRRGWIQ